MKKYKTLALAAVIALALPTAVPAEENRSETYRQLKLFSDVFERVRSDYVEETTDEELIEFAIQGMLSALDPHSSYLNADSFKDMRVQTKGEFGGLGIEVTMENGFVKVVSPIDDTPADRAGVEAGDFITHLDGEAVLGMTLNEAVEKMRGKVNTDLKLTIRRENVEPFDIVVTVVLDPLWSEQRGLSTADVRARVELASRVPRGGGELLELSRSELEIDPLRGEIAWRAETPHPDVVLHVSCGGESRQVRVEPRSPDRQSARVELP